MVSGKEFRISLRKHKNKQRLVAPFSQQSMQANTKVIPPKRIYNFQERRAIKTIFRKYFDRGDIPIVRSFTSETERGKVLQWLVPIEQLDYSHYLPIFFDGLAESIPPYNLLARNGVHDMLAVGGDKILPVIPQLIIPIRNALNTRNKEVVVATLLAIQHLLKTGPYIGKSLVPYFRQILPIFNLMRNINVNIGDKIDFNRNGNVGDKIEETLNMLEEYGGSDAFINIKYMVPTYESSVMN